MPKTSMLLPKKTQGGGLGFFNFHSSLLNISLFHFLTPALFPHFTLQNKCGTWTAIHINIQIESKLIMTQNSPTILYHSGEPHEYFL
jgi:hypothetical protein